MTDARAMEAGGGARRVQGLLLAGMLAGLGAALVTLLTGHGAGGVPDGAVARVDDRVITRDAWLRAVAAVASERRTALTAADRRRILDRLVDEELLVQHGLRLGLVENDRRLRGQLVGDVIAAATAEFVEPDEDALRAYYEKHRDYFTTEARVRVAATRLGGAPLAPPVPDALLPASTLREYLGPQLTEIALALAPGQTQSAGDVTLRVLEKQAPAIPAFDAIRAEVREALLREADEAAVRRLLDELRASQRVIVRTDLE